MEKVKSNRYHVSYNIMVFVNIVVVRGPTSYGGVWVIQNSNICIHTTRNVV